MMLFEQRSVIVRVGLSALVEPAANALARAVPRPEVGTVGPVPVGASVGDDRTGELVGPTLAGERWVVTVWRGRVPTALVDGEVIAPLDERVVILDADRAAGGRLLHPRHSSRNDVNASLSAALRPLAPPFRRLWRCRVWIRFLSM